MLSEIQKEEILKEADKDIAKIPELEKAEVPYGVKLIEKSKKMLEEAFVGEQIVLIENEFGDIGIDGAFMQDAGITVNEINSGCICCSLVGDFSKALAEVVETYSPERIIIEPSGVGKLSDVIKAVRDAGLENAVINSATVVVDASKCKLYMKNFGEFFNNQVENAKCIVLSHTKGIKEEKLHKAIELIREAKGGFSDILVVDYADFV
mgnify:CR=1 FL=1